MQKIKLHQNIKDCHMKLSKNPFNWNDDYMRLGQQQ